MASGSPALSKPDLQKRFAKPDPEGIDLVGRYASDPPLVVSTLVNAVAERASASGSKVLELGPGSGWLLTELGGALPAASLYALDISPGIAMNARELMPGRIEVVVGDIESLPFGPSAYDVVVTCWTLYFMKDIDATLQSIKAAIKPGGRLIAATNAPDHEAELDELLREACDRALGTAPNEDDLGRPFDLETGEAYMARNFESFETREWRGELAVENPEHLRKHAERWWRPTLDAESWQQVLAELVQIGRERLQSNTIKIRRHGGAFIADTRVQADNRG